MSEEKKNTESDWNYVDIFLFSNGQQQTPPRKYHLRTSDLNNWNNTLMNLAHSQYETIFSTIDLYTVEGKKVLTPMQVSHGMSYVAVPPQDTFIHAGYNDYLLKASRSREKRKSTNFSLGGTQPSVEFNALLETDRESKEEKDINIFDDEKEIIATTLNAHTSNVTKLESQQTAKSDLRTNATKRRLSINKPSVIGKVSSGIPPTSRKTSMKTKDHLVKKNLKVNTSNAMSAGSAVVTGSNNSIALPKTKIITKINKTMEKEGVVIPIELSANGHVYKNISYEKYVTTESSSVGNILDDQELIVVKNPDSEIASMYLERDKSGSVYTRQTRLSSVGPVLTPIHESDNSELNKDVTFTTINNVAENVYKQEVSIANNPVPIKNRSKLNIDVASAHQLEIHDKKMLINKQTTDSLVAVVDKRERDVVNLNLKIELRNGDGVASVQCDRCQTNLHNITEKGSQANIEQFFINCTKKTSRLTNNSGADEKSPKIVVVHCACCDHHNIDEILQQIDTTAVKLEDKNYIILLPNPQHNTDVEMYRKERLVSKTPPSSPINRASVANPLKKVHASTWLHEMLRNIDDIIQQSQANVISEESKIFKTSSKIRSTHDIGVTSSKVEVHVNENEHFEKVVNKVRSNHSIGVTSSKVEMRIDEDRSIGKMRNKVEKKISTSNFEKITSRQFDQTNSRTLSSHEIHNTQSLIIRNSIRNTPILTKENNTQTDWCSMLLEARLHEDGLYSFHLPPLNVLKYYGF